MAYKEIYTKPDGGIPDSDIASANTWNNKVPSTRKVNGKALSSDIALTASDVGALPTSGGSLTGNLTVGSSNIGTNGYIEGTWLRTTKATESAGDFATISGGWIYKRAPANVLGDIGGQAKITANGILKGDGNGSVVAATRGSDYIASGNIVKQTLVSTETTPTEDYAINWIYG